MSSCDLTKNLENVIDFDALINIIVNGHYKVVTLQFSDDYLCICSDIFTILRSKMDSLCSIESKAMDIVEFYVTADSTFGSAIDDISAMHVSSDLILFFGTDLSSSGTIPTVIVPVIRDVDVCQCSTLICASICASLSDEIEYSNIILLSSLPYYHSLPKISSSVAGLLVEKNQSRNVAVGKLPNEASVSNWLNLNRNSSNGSIPGNSCESTSKEISSPTNTSIGGFIVESFMTEETNPNKNCFVYIGAENEQFHSILLSVGDKHDVLFVDAVDYSKRMYCSGCPQSALAIRKRYGGILKVKDASVIGLLVGSMGVSQKKIVKCIDRMKILIKTAHKKSYVFVMGRVTETKLCNFPEVDVFVLISNDDSCYVPPK